MDHCIHEKEWGEVFTTMKNTADALERIEKKVAAHIYEGEREGGVRDRVHKVEWEVSELKKRFWWSAIVGGVIGALIGSGSSEAVITLVRFITKG